MGCDIADSVDVAASPINGLLLELGDDLLCWNARCLGEGLDDCHIVLGINAGEATGQRPRRQPNIIVLDWAGRLSWF